ncbi:MAG: DUF805 domain-containing protein [Rothia sp. (in: high G+C Gram-positive bacteria)]|nr:DUF805 domain-containing protein [Rothia sp. (in: high G+C Gram-positive bacteria)]
MMNPNASTPRPGIGPIEASRLFIAKGLTLKGRASRAEFWWPSLVFTGAAVACDLAGRYYDRAHHPQDYSGADQSLLGKLPFIPNSAPGAQETPEEKKARKDAQKRADKIALLFSAPLLVAVTIPSFTVSVRRLHDINLSGHWLWLNAVPVAGSVASLVLSALPGNPEGARFDR